VFLSLIPDPQITLRVIISQSFIVSTASWMPG
jgi:hypothetical protein